ncbi:MAG: hypothetical protein JSV84_04915 [Gemmatimonadota bacterium]|nr:MAG: hypothetical protein JSV84_04915 [Gemmatimonadota bacterium]
MVIEPMEPVRVIGSVREGDYIIPSGFEDGTGIAVPPELMTAEEYTRVVGRSWEDSNNFLEKLVNCAVGLNMKDVAVFLEKTERKNRELEALLEQLEMQTLDMETYRQKISEFEEIMNHKNSKHELEKSTFNN